MVKIYVDGIETNLQKIDKSTDKQEQPDRNIMPVSEQTELGQALAEFNKDEVNEDRLSSIDFRARIDKIEMPYMIIFDSLIGMKVAPVVCGILNRTKMRKSASLGGKGREEYVSIITGRKQMENEGGFMQGMKNFAGVGKQE